MSDPDAAQSPHRLERALAAFLRQEFSAPVASIIGIAEVLLEDARENGPADLLPDLDRIRIAGLQLSDLLDRLVDVALPAFRGEGTDFVAFKAELRHELRTPLNAVKGYGELIQEEARATGRDALAADVDKLLGAADQLLRQIDALGEPVKLSAGVAGEPLQSEDVASLDLVKQVIQSIRPVLTGPEGAWARRESSHILVVDDTAANRDLLSRWLSREGHVVEQVTNGLSAIERLGKGDIDLVLLDLMMPVMNGFEALCRLKADPGTQNVPVIMISALNEMDSIVRCIEAGAEDYLPKPFNQVLLRARISACLEKKRLRDREREFIDQLRLEKEKSEALLLNVLPRTVIERIRRGENVIADRFDEATVLFSDVVGFSNLAARFSPSQISELLNELFSRFDNLAAELGLEKIKTIGDAYMVAGGLPESQPGHAVAAAEMALRILDVVKDTGKSVGVPLEVRIGVHSGAVVAGIIGRHKFIYDVWGDTVNTASRLESYGIPGQVHISEATHARIRHVFNCRSRGMVDIKGKGEMLTYFIHERHA